MTLPTSPSPRADERSATNAQNGDAVLGVKRHCDFLGHEAAVFGLAFDPTGKTFATTSMDKTVKLWVADTGLLMRTLADHQSAVQAVAFDPTGNLVVSGSDDKSVKLWETGTGKLIRTFEGHEEAVVSVAFDPTGRFIASGGRDALVKLWDASTGKLLRTLRGHRNPVLSVAYDPSGKAIASGSFDETVKLWEVEAGKPPRTLEGRGGAVSSVVYTPDGRTVASGSKDGTVKIWEAASGKLLRTLEGGASWSSCVAYSPGGLFLAASSVTEGVRIWRCDTWDMVARIPELSSGYWLTKLAFHPTLQKLATVGSLPEARRQERDRVIHLWDLDCEILLGRTPTAPPPQRAVHYVNAKVVLVGDTGVGKSGLSLVLNGRPFEATESTAGRHVWPFDTREIELPGDVHQIRETLLWDLAGQPGYRVIHQLHLNEIAVAVILFDSRSEVDPLAGVRHWECALRLAQQRQGDQVIPLRKFLVASRVDRGGVPVTKERVDNFIKDFGFDGYFETSAREGWKIKELREAIERAIPWDELPVVTSSELFANLKEFLLQIKKSGRLLASVSDLFAEFEKQHPELAKKYDNLRSLFESCVGRLENRDLVRRLSFGGLVLLQSELLDSYASAMVNTAKAEPDGLGSIAEEVVLAGKFYVPKEQKIEDPAQAALLLRATVEELLRHELVLRDGGYLVFPSQFSREYEAGSDPPGKALAINFQGPAQSIYSTLAVRLGYTGSFESARTEMWRNAAIMTARAGGKCGLYLQELGEAKARLILFFDPETDTKTRAIFEDFVQAHLEERAIKGSVQVVRYFVCGDCGTPVPDAYVKNLRAQAKLNFHCPCGGAVPLADPKDIKDALSGYASEAKIADMNKEADKNLVKEVTVLSGGSETLTPPFIEWAGGTNVTLAIVYTDVVGSSALENAIGGMRMNEIREAHFVQARKLIASFNGWEIKTMGDAFMVAFKSVDEAYRLAAELRKDSGHPEVKIRAGIHIGPMQVKKDDVFGGTVNFAARVIGAIEGAEIWLSERAKDDLVLSRGGALKWDTHPGITAKGFGGTYTLWSLKSE